MPENHSVDPDAELPSDLQHQATGVDGPEPDDIFSDSRYEIRGKKLNVRTTSTDVFDRMQETVDAMEMLAAKSLASDVGFKRASRKPVRGADKGGAKNRVLLKKQGEMLQRAQDMFKGDFHRMTDKHSKEILEYSDIVPSFAFARYRNVELPALIKDTTELKDALEAKRAMTVDQGAYTASLDESIKGAEERLILLDHIRRSLWGIGEAGRVFTPRKADKPTSGASPGADRATDKLPGGDGSDDEYEDVDDESEDIESDGESDMPVD